MGKTSLIVAAALVAGCGGNHDDHGGPDAAIPADAPSGFQPAPHTPMPQAVPHGSKIIAHPELVTITFTDDANAATYKAFGDAIVQSDWLKAVGADYGVGTGSHVGMVQVGAAPASFASANDIQTFIQNKITDGTLPAPTATYDTHVYMLYVPRKVSLGADLQNEYGHHGMGTAKGDKIAFAVILDPSFNTLGVDEVTTTAAHELIESATDPYEPAADEGWYVDQALPDPWYLIAGEVADLCDGEDLIKSGSFTVQRSYSNTAAAAGKNPCVPEDPDDRWNDVSASPATVPTIPAGGTATFTLTGWSTAEVPDWELSEYTADYSDLQDTDMNPTFSAKTINNGKTVTLTLHAPATAKSGQLGGIYVLSGKQMRPWPVGFQVQ